MLCLCFAPTTETDDVAGGVLLVSTLSGEGETGAFFSTNGQRTAFRVDLSATDSYTAEPGFPRWNCQRVSGSGWRGGVEPPTGEEEVTEGLCLVGNLSHVPH